MYVLQWGVGGRGERQMTGPSGHSLFRVRIADDREKASFRGLDRTAKKLRYKNAKYLRYKKHKKRNKERYALSYELKLSGPYTIYPRAIHQLLSTWYMYTYTRASKRESGIIPCEIKDS